MRRLLLLTDRGGTVRIFLLLTRHDFLPLLERLLAARFRLLTGRRVVLLALRLLLHLLAALFGDALFTLFILRPCLPVAKFVRARRGVLLLLLALKACALYFGGAGAFIRHGDLRRTRRLRALGNSRGRIRKGLRLDGRRRICRPHALADLGRVRARTREFWACHGLRWSDLRG